MKIQNKIFVLHAALTVVFMMGLMYLRDVERDRLELFKNQQMLERKDIFSKIIKMTALNLEGFLGDYSIWDDMVTFISTGDRVWAKRNIDSSLEWFKLDVAWIYNLNSQVIYVPTEPDLAVLAAAPIPFVDLAEVFHGSSFIEFFVGTESGLMEIHGATINRESDLERKEPQGYMFIARIWDQEFLESLGALMGSKVELTGSGMNQAVRSDTERVGEISFIYPLKGLDGKDVANIQVSFHSDVISRANVISRNLVVLIFVSLLTLLLIVTWALIFWVSLPLRNISLALTKEDARAIDGLANRTNEMGDIARLIKQFFRQKHKLSLEVQERELAEQHLEKAYHDLKSMQNQLFQREKMASIGQLAAGVAHEINNPVGFICNNMDILSQYVDGYRRVLKIVENIKGHADVGDLGRIKLSVEELRALEAEIKLDFINEDVAKLVGHSNRGLERIRKIVMDLRTFSHADSEEVKESVKIENVIEGILSIVQSELKAKAELIKEYGDTPPVLCNSQRIGQVLINILVNATQAIKENGKITVKTYTQGQFVCVDISDTGCGIPPENMKRLFDPFFTTKPVGQGTGLGLSVSYETVKKQGGEIRVSSTMGEGSTFTLMFPYIQPNV